MRAKIGESVRRAHERKKGERWVVDENGCHLWQWGQSAGYPSQGVRRHIWELEFGPYPRGWPCHHHCGVKLCVNPTHQVPLSREDHDALHVRLKRLGFADLPVPERIALSHLQLGVMLATRELVRT